MVFKIILSSLLFVNIANAIVMEEGHLFKEKQELITIKDELNDFYEAKELEYQKAKGELEKLEKATIQAEKNIQALRDENKKILQEIKREISNKAMKMYDKVKLGVVVNVFKEMIKEDKMDDVFDILIRLKDKRVMKILKKFDTKTSTIIMQKMRIFKEDNEKITK